MGLKKGDEAERHLSAIKPHNSIAIYSATDRKCEGIYDKHSYELITVEPLYCGDLGDLVNCPLLISGVIFGTYMKQSVPNTEVWGVLLRGVPLYFTYLLRLALAMRHKRVLATPKLHPY